MPPKESEKAQRKREKKERLREKKERKLIEQQIKQSNEKVIEARAVLDQVVKATGMPNFTKALAILNEAITLHPENYEAFILRGNVRRDQFELHDAIDDYSKAIELFANAHLAYEGRAACYELQRDFDRAMQDYTRIIEIDELNDHAYNMRGACLLKKRPPGLLMKEADYKAVVADLTTALRLNEFNYHAHTNLGKAHNDQRNYALAVQCFTQALKVNKNYRYANYRRACANIALAGELQREEDRYAASLASIRKQLDAMASSSPTTPAAPATGRSPPSSPNSIATVHGSGANAAKRRVLLGQRVERHAEDELVSAQHHVSLEAKHAAVVAQRSKCLNSAVSDLNLVIDKERKNLEITAVIHLANCYFDLGEDDLAVVEYNDALKSIPSDDAAMTLNTQQVQQFLDATAGSSNVADMLLGTFSGTLSASLLSSTMAMGSVMMAAPLGDTALLKQIIQSKLQQLAARKKAAVVAPVAVDADGNPVAA